DAWAVEGVGVANTGRFRPFRREAKRALDLGGAKPVAGDVNDIVDAPGYPVVSVLVAAAAVACEVFARIGLEVHIDKPLVIAIHGAHLSWPRVGDAKIAARRASLHLALSVHDFRLHAKEWTRCRAPLTLRSALHSSDK